MCGQRGTQTGHLNGDQWSARCRKSLERLLLVQRAFRASQDTFTEPYIRMPSR